MSIPCANRVDMTEYVENKCERKICACILCTAVLRLPMRVNFNFHETFLCVDGIVSLLSDVLTKDVPTPTKSKITLCETSCLVIDGHSLVMALGKPCGATVYGQ